MDDLPRNIPHTPFSLGKFLNRGSTRPAPPNPARWARSASVQTPVDFLQASRGVAQLLESVQQFVSARIGDSALVAGNAVVMRMSDGFLSAHQFLGGPIKFLLDARDSSSEFPPLLHHRGDDAVLFVGAHAGKGYAPHAPESSPLRATSPAAPGRTVRCRG